MNTMVIREDAKKTVEYLVDLARHEVWNNHRYLDRLETETARAMKQPQQRTTPAARDAEAVYRADFPRGVRKQSGAKEKEIMESSRGACLSATWTLDI